MQKNKMSRRDYLKLVGPGVAVAAAMNVSCTKAEKQREPKQQAETFPEPSPAERSERARRLKWWHEARFGMFIHWGLFSVIGQHEWAMEMEGIPVADYEQLARHFVPRPHAARAWAKLAKQAGQKYMVMTTKHLEGFCMFDTKYTNYCAPKQACGRDLVREFVEAAREQGLRVGFYYCLWDTHHPDGDRWAYDEAARKRFVEYTHGQIRELCTNYGKIDILWYDAGSVQDAKRWESERMNKMVFELQPDIIVNNRNGLPGDFSTPEQEIKPAKGGHAWETCMTMNDSWGYQKADDAWKSPKTIIRNLITCSTGGGNYLLNIGPKADGSIPEESIRILTTVGKWMGRNGATIYESEPCQPQGHLYANYTRKENTLYIHVHFWPGATAASNWLQSFNPPTVVAIGGLRTKVKSARLFASGKKVDFQQDEIAVRFTGLPAEAPDDPVTVLAVECESEPVVDLGIVDKKRKREKV